MVEEPLKHRYVPDPSLFIFFIQVVLKPSTFNNNKNPIDYPYVAST